MSDYRIIVTPDAIRDLTELRDYIADVLLAPETALACIQTIRREIGSLARMPARNKCVDQEPWHSRGVRKIIVKNFYVYYRIDEPAGVFRHDHIDRRPCLLKKAGKMRHFVS